MSTLKVKMLNGKNKNMKSKSVINKVNTYVCYRCITE